MSCHNSYIEEIGRLFRMRLEEHQKERFYRNAQQLLESTISKSALTDPVSRENRVIGWEGDEIVDRE